MTRSEFRELTRLVKTDALEVGNEEQAPAWLESAMAEMEIPAIEAFQQQLSQVLFAIDGENHANHAGEPGRSDDGFLYARCHVVARGEDHYSRVRAAPALMHESVDQWCESLLYVAPDAWARKTSSDPSDRDFEPTASHESGSNKSLWSEAGAFNEQASPVG